MFWPYLCWLLLGVLKNSFFLDRINLQIASTSQKTLTLKRFPGICSNAILPLEGARDGVISMRASLVTSHMAVLLISQNHSQSLS